MSEAIIDFFVALPEHRLSEDLNDLSVFDIISWLKYHCKKNFILYNSVETENFWDLAFRFYSLHAKLEGTNELNVVYTTETFVTTESTVEDVWTKCLLWSNGVIVLQRLGKTSEVFGLLYIEADTVNIFGYPIPS